MYIKLNNLNNVKSYNIAVGENEETVILANANQKKSTKLMNFINNNKLNNINSFFIDCDAKNIESQEINILKNILKNFKGKLKIFIETKNVDEVSNLVQRNNLTFSRITNRHFYLNR